jgi:hypothetical protein
MRKLIVTTEGQDRLRLRELCQAWANEQWVASHMTPEQAAASLLDCFKRALRQELELLDIRCEEIAAHNGGSTLTRCSAMRLPTSRPKGSSVAA